MQTRLDGNVLIEVAGEVDVAVVEAVAVVLNAVVGAISGGIKEILELTDGGEALNAVGIEVGAEVVAVLAVVEVAVVADAEARIVESWS